MNNYAAEKLTASWVKQNGMNFKQFDKVDLLLIRAQQTAHNLLKLHSTLLTSEQTTTLNDYLIQINNKKLQKKLTDKKAYAVLNIGKQINRQLFKRYKAADKSLL